MQPRRYASAMRHAEVLHESYAFFIMPRRRLPRRISSPKCPVYAARRIRRHATPFAAFPRFFCAFFTPRAAKSAVRVCRHCAARSAAIFRAAPRIRQPGDIAKDTARTTRRPHLPSPLMPHVFMPEENIAIAHRAATAAMTPSMPRATRARRSCSQRGASSDAFLPCFAFAARCRGTPQI